MCRAAGLIPCPASQDTDSAGIIPGAVFFVRPAGGTLSDWIMGSMRKYQKEVHSKTLKPVLVTLFKTSALGKEFAPENS